ncbi:MAG: DUF1990 domain-containing protein [Actinomycetota bacterium]
MTALANLRRRAGLANVHLRRPSAAWLEALRADQADRDVTYAEVGATLADLPDGYHHLRAERPLGSAPGDFERGRDAIRAWAGHGAMSMHLAPTTPPLDEGTTMTFALPFPLWPRFLDAPRHAGGAAHPLARRAARALPLAPALGPWVSGACRVMRVVDTDTSFGFAYGTLPHHPERGEEAFLVHRRDDGSVVFEIVAFSRPATLPTRAIGPLGRRLQRRSIDRYLAGFVTAARSAS